MLWPFKTWPTPSRPPAAVDRWSPPGARRLEHHALELDAAPAAALAALQALTLRELPAVRALFSLRGLRSDPATTLRDFFSSSPFAILEEDPGREVVFAVGAPPAAWSPVRAEASRAHAPEAFRRAAARLPFIAVGNFRAEPDGTGARLWTETWVSTSGAPATVAFTAYWLAIAGFSAWTRRMFLRGAREHLARR